MNLELYDHANTRRLAQEAWMMTCTDGRTPEPETEMTHPRTFGAFPKKMRHFVFEEDLLAPEFVIRSYSGLAADFYSLPDRGYLREGYIADIAVIDPARYRDKATFDNPREQEYEKFVAAMQAAAGKKVWVHCAANARVSAFVFRYRCGILGEDNQAARQDLEKIWHPVGVWKKFIRRDSP